MKLLKIGITKQRKTQQCGTFSETLELLELQENVVHSSMEFNSTDHVRKIVFAGLYCLSSESEH